MSSVVGNKPQTWLARVGRILWLTPLTGVRAAMVLLSLVVTGLVVIEVAVRYVTFTPQLWVEELCLWFVFWYYLSGAVYATYKRTHITGGIMNLVFRSKPRVQEGISIATTAVSMVLSGFFAVLAYQQFVYSLKVNPRTIHLLLPLAYARLALLVGFSLMLLYFLAELIDRIRHFTVKTTTEAQGVKQ